MNNKTHYTISSRENFLLSILNKVINEYKKITDQIKKNRPLKIIEISNLSSIPGETIFTIQISDKNCIARLSAAEIIEADYCLNDFSDYHSDMIRMAAQGRLIEFLRLSDIEPIYRVVSKRYDRSNMQHIFTLETKDNRRFARTADEIANDKLVLTNINNEDAYDIGFTHGTETLALEQSILKKAKHI